MFFRGRQLTSTQILSYGLFAFSVIIMAATFYFISNIRVLEDWKLVLPEQQIHSGDQLVLVSQYTKLRNVDGTSLRYLECKNRDGIYIRYPINTAVANRQAGSGGTGIPIVVPRNIPDLPTTCKFSISITYNVLPFKKDIEKNSTPEFRLLPAVEPPNPAISTPRE